MIENDGRKADLLFAGITGGLWLLSMRSAIYETMRLQSMSFESHRWGDWGDYEIWLNGESHTHSLKIVDYEKCDHSWFSRLENHALRQLYCQLNLIYTNMHTHLVCIIVACIEYMYCVITFMRSMFNFLYSLTAYSNAIA